MDIANTAQTKVEVIELYIDEKLSEILLNKSVKLDELNFFFKLYEDMSDREKLIFYAVADAKNPETMKELINLTANTNCYHLVDDFSNLKELGRNLYLNEQGRLPFLRGDVAERQKGYGACMRACCESLMVRNM